MLIGGTRDPLTAKKHGMAFHRDDELKNLFWKFCTATKFIQKLYLHETEHANTFKRLHYTIAGNLSKIKNKVKTVSYLTKNFCTSSN